MTKLKWNRRQIHPSPKPQPEIHSTIQPQRKSTKLQIRFALTLLRDLRLKLPDDERNLRAMGRTRLSHFIESLLKRKSQVQGNKPSPSTTGRDNSPASLASVREKRSTK